MNEPVLDNTTFSEIAELMGDSLSEFITTYLDNSPKLLKNIHQALSETNLDSIFHDAHQLKGGSGSIGAIQVFELASQIEEQAKDGQSEELAGLIDHLQSAYNLVEIELKTYL